MKKILFVSCAALFMCCTNLSAQQIDSLTRQHDSVSHTPNLFYQFLGGNIGYAIPFFLFGGTSFLRNSDNITFSIPLGLIGCGYSVTKIGELTSTEDGSYWAGIGGAFLSTIIGGALYTYSYDRIKSEVVRFFILSIPPTLVSMLLVDLTMSPNKETGVKSGAKSDFQGFLFPEVSKNYVGLSFIGKF